MARLRALRAWVSSSWWGRILAEHDTEPLELGNSLMLFGLGALLASDRTSTFRTTPLVYDLLAALPEDVWAAGMIALALAQLASLRANRRRVRRLAALGAFLVWFTWSVSFALGNPFNTGWYVYLLAAVGQGWCWIRLGILVRVVGA